VCSPDCCTLARLCLPVPANSADHASCAVHRPPRGTQEDAIGLAVRVAHAAARAASRVAWQAQCYPREARLARAREIEHANWQLDRRRAVNVKEGAAHFRAGDVLTSMRWPLAPGRGGPNGCGSGSGSGNTNTNRPSRARLALEHEPSFLGFLLLPVRPTSTVLAAASANGNPLPILRPNTSRAIETGRRAHPVTAAAAASARGRMQRQPQQPAPLLPRKLGSPRRLANFKRRSPPSTLAPWTPPDTASSYSGGCSAGWEREESSGGCKGDEGARTASITAAAMGAAAAGTRERTDTGIDVYKRADIHPQVAAPAWSSPAPASSNLEDLRTAHGKGKPRARSRPRPNGTPFPFAGVHGREMQPAAVRRAIRSRGN
jgi:hypothetical protein